MEKKIEHSIFYLVFGVAMLGASIFLIKDGSHTGYLLVSIALFLIWTSVHFLTHAVKEKKKFQREVGEISERHVRAGAPFVFDFAEDHFSYKDSGYEIKLQWSLLGNVRVIDKTLLISLSKRKDNSFSLSEAEVGEQQFKEIVEFVKGKVQQAKAQKP